MSLDFAFLGVITLFETKTQTQISRDLVNQPEAGVMARINVIGPGVTEADY
jgi:hypothetical protein